MTRTTLAIVAGICLSMWSLASNAQHTVGETVDDTTITSMVKAALTDNDEVHARNINVETYKGTVALIGYTRSDAQHKAAMQVAKDVNGVSDVVDAILVVPEKRSFGKTIDDQTLETKVKLAVTEIGAGNVFSVITEVRNGEALLGGFVKDSATLNEIDEAVKKIKGVVKVHNRLSAKD